MSIVFNFGGMRCGLLVKEQSQLNKDKIAVATDEQSLTFSELYEKAYDLARYIQSLHKKSRFIY